jgi:hypothetical protein
MWAKAGFIRVLGGYFAEITGEIIFHRESERDKNRRFASFVGV